jgi:hypothetical protein
MAQQFCRNDQHNRTLYRTCLRAVQNAVTVKAVSQADSTKSAAAVVTLLNSVPALSSIDVTQVNTGLAFTLHITGTNFLPTAVVAFSDNTAATVTTRSSTQLTVTGTSSSRAATVVHVTVVNPNPGATTSNAKKSDGGAADCGDCLAGHKNRP